MKFIFRSPQRPPWLYTFTLLCIIQISFTQQVTNSTQTQNDGKGLKVLAEAKNETVEVKIDVVRKEMRDFMRECGVDIPEEQSTKGNVEVVNGAYKAMNTNKLGNLNMAPMGADNLNDGRKKKKNKGTYPTSYGNSGGKRKNKKRGRNDDCDDDVDDSCEDDDDNSGSDEDEDDRRRSKGKKGKGGGRGGRNRRHALVEQFNVTVGGEAIDGGENTEANENLKDKKNKRRGGSKRGGNRDYDDDEDEEDEDDDDKPKRCGGGGKKGGGRGKGKNRGGQGGGGKNKKKGNKGGRGGNKGGGKKQGGDDGFGGGDDGLGHGGGGNLFETGLGPGMGDNYGYPSLSGGGYFHGNPYAYGSYSGYIRQVGDSEAMSRIKRQEEKNECVSQCVFGYMEVLDDNKVPSETALISYYQEKLTNDKKSETIRNVRRCFARLIATDTEDGCKFSKEVSKCLNLDLDP